MMWPEEQINLMIIIFHITRSLKLNETNLHEVKSPEYVIVKYIQINDNSQSLNVFHGWRVQRIRSTQSDNKTFAVIFQKHIPFFLDETFTTQLPQLFIKNNSFYLMISFTTAQRICSYIWNCCCNFEKVAQHNRPDSNGIRKSSSLKNIGRYYKRILYMLNKNLVSHWHFPFIFKQVIHIKERKFQTLTDQLTDGRLSWSPDIQLGIYYPIKQSSY